MLTQQELLVSELMGIMLAILNSKEDRLKKVCMHLGLKQGRQTEEGMHVYTYYILSPQTRRTD